jgi:23S rRNA (guanosine2251-2'-O)-methyltransferase
MNGDLPLSMRKLGMDELGRKSVNDFRQSEKMPVVVVLDNIRSMHNVGSVFRTGDAFLIQSIYLCGYTPQPPHRDIHKTALGATETVTWRHFPATVDAIASLKEEGYTVLAVEQTVGSMRLNELGAAFAGASAAKPVAMVFGNEVTGVDPAALALCDGSVEIPQWGMKHSLNVSIAAGIVLWELVRDKTIL